MAPLRDWKEVPRDRWPETLAEKGKAPDTYPELYSELESLESETTLFLAQRVDLELQAFTRDAVVWLRADASEPDFGADALVLGQIPWLPSVYWCEVAGASLEEVSEAATRIESRPDVQHVEPIGFQLLPRDAARQTSSQLEALQEEAAPKCPKQVERRGCAAGVSLDMKQHLCDAKIADLWRTTDAGCGAGVLVAVIDAGFDRHAQLDPAVDWAASATFGGPYPGISRKRRDLVSLDGSKNRHGTGCAGLVGSRLNRNAADSEMGTAPACRLGLLRMQQSALLSSFHFANALSFSCSPDYDGRRGQLADIVSCSLGVASGGRRMTRSLQHVLKQITTRPRGRGGALVCFASPYQDQARNIDTWTARQTGVLSVGSWAYYGEEPRREWGTLGIDLLAPHKPINTIVGDIGTRTSLSAPLVAGTAAVIAARFPDLEITEIKKSLFQGAWKMPQHDPTLHGLGRLDALAAFKEAQKLAKPGA